VAVTAVLVVCANRNSLASFNGITSSANQIGANVYNPAVLVSLLQSPTATPRFLLRGWHYKQQRIVGKPPI